MAAPRAGGLWIFAGPDRYRRRQRVQADAAALQIDPLDCHERLAAELTAGSLAALVREVPARSVVRLVILEEAHRLEAACVAWLAERGESLRETARVVLATDLPFEAAKALAPLAKEAQLERFDWLAPAEAMRWAGGYAQAAGKRLTSEAAAELIRVCGSDLHACRALLEQLIAWVAVRESIGREDLAALAPSFIGAAPGGPGRTEPAVKPFALSEAIARRDGAGALKAMDEQLASGRDILELLGLVAWQLQRWLAIGRLAQAGVPAERIAAALKMQTWQLARSQAELRTRRLDQLQEWLEVCWRIDTSIKSGRTIPRLALESLVLEMCGAPTAGGTSR